ncbi:futalosine hydrolase [Desulfohalobiaceae bacterium Ax17]|jgi:futalosine hydrolase|uniref:futalosine hydrolase n=1 Tax=Desulfovulcanus ferrireducens TaxID=2831190 RepID=UPI00207B9E2D|nr:futalosine hydrolase [Desulfovulcanus ferrireducens]MBT8762600.1 futalosine hydrolase [Desulfovulcanus ferrireducens]
MLVFAAATIKELGSFIHGHLPLPKFDSGLVVTTYKNKEVAFLVTGIGPLNASHKLTACVTEYNVSGVVNIGIAGSFDLNSLGLGDICVAKREIWPEFGLVTDDGIQARGLGFAQAAINGEKIWDVIELSPELASKDLGVFLPMSWSRVISLTVAGVTGAQARARLLRQKYGAHIENMEGFALAYVCILRQIPFIEVRTISNLVGSRDKKDWNISLALKKLNSIWPTFF